MDPLVGVAPYRNFKGAATLALRPADVEVFRGHTTRDKWVLVRGVDEPTLRANLVRFGPQ